MRANLRSREGEAKRSWARRGTLTTTGRVGRSAQFGWAHTVDSGAIDGGRVLAVGLNSIGPVPVPQPRSNARPADSGVGPSTSAIRSAGGMAHFRI